MLGKIKLFLTLFCVSYSLNVFSETKDNANKLMVEFAKKNNNPIVVSPRAMISFLGKDEVWRWEKIHGIYIGYSKDEDIESIKLKIKNNLSAIDFFQVKHKNSEAKITSYRTSIPNLLEHYPQQCGIEIDYDEEVIGEISFRTEEYIKLSEVCRVFIYSFALNDINLVVDSLNEKIIATKQ